MKPKRELSVGQKIRFSGPTTRKSDILFYNKEIVGIAGIDPESDMILIKLNGFLTQIHRRQVVSVFVKKPKRKKLRGTK